MRLAAHHKNVNVDEMLATMTCVQMQEWENFYRIEPWGAEVEELRLGNICSVLANLKRDPKSKPLPFMASDFFATFIKPKSEYQSTDDLIAAIEGALGG